MPSEGSVSTTSSGIRQFGLYRTIDSRTEEFLRLSRKRQIRQGCACAAISTAITVAVVISIILIYEYSIIYEPNSKITLKSNWLSFMNNSLESLPFEAKVNKARIQLDPTYIKFLPLILKTMKKNRFFDKIIEEDSSQNPLYERRETPDDTFTKNVFSDTRNWMRMPTSRIYSIEYKTSPIIYFKNPTRNIDHFTKIRRIRDYQRIMNYVDKMINEKVTVGSTVPMFKSSRSFYKEPQIAMFTSPMPKTENYVANKQIPEKVSLTKDEKTHCRCPKRMSILLSKLIKSLQKLIPDFTNDEVHNPHPCHNDSRIPLKVTEQKEPTKNQFDPIQYKGGIIPPSLLPKHPIPYFTKTNFVNTNENYGNNYDIDQTTETNDNYTPNIQSVSTTNSDYHELSNTESKSTYISKPFHAKIEYNLSSIMKLLEPNWLPLKKIPDYKNVITTTANQFIEGTDADYYLQETTTKPMTRFTVTTKKLLKKVPTVKHFVLHKNNSNNTFSTLSSSNDDDVYEDYMDTTTNSINNYKMLDDHSIELLKRKILAPTYSIRTNNVKYNNLQTYQATTKPQDNQIHQDIENEYNKTRNLLHQMGKIALSTVKPNINFSSENQTTTEIVTENFLDNTNKPSIVYRQKSIEHYLNKNKPEQQSKSEDITLEEEIDKDSPDELTSDDSLKNLENLLNKLNDSEIFNKTLGEESSEMYEWELIKINEKDNSTRSMIPESRSSYLEIHRGDWKQDEPQEYDTNINNYFFE